MKILLYSKNQKIFGKSGIGRAFSHQSKAMELAKIDYTYDPKDNFDIIHINLLFHSSYKYMRKMQKKGYPVVVHGHSTRQDFEHSFALWRLIYPWYNSRISKLYKKADLIITPTKYSKYLIETTPLVKAPVIALSNGIDLDKYKYKQENVDLFRMTYNLSETDKVIIGVGLPFERKGLHDFIEVARSLPDYKFIWFGGLAKIFTTHFIKKAIKKRPNNVIMAGYVNGPTILGAFSSADVCFFPSYEETEGIVVLEALAAKTSLIVRDIPVYNSWLIDKVNVIMGHNNNEFKDLIVESINNKNNEIIDNGYGVAQSRSLDVVGNELKKIYQNILDNKKLK